MKKNILITSAGKRVALVKAFKDSLIKVFHDSKVYTTDMNPCMAPAAYVSDGCISVPRVMSEDYIGILQEICLKYDIGLVVPTIDTELAILSANKGIFDKIGTHVCVSDYNFIMMCRDKRNTGAFFEKNGCPPTFSAPARMFCAPPLWICARRHAISSKVISNQSFMETTLISF